MAKFITADEAACFVKDSDTVAISSFTALSLAEDLIVGIRDRFLNEGHPRDLSIFHCSGVGDYESKGLSHFAHPGLIRKIYGAHAAPYPKLNPMMSNGEIEVYMVPQGVCVHLTRAMAGGEAGLLTKVGLNTYADPRLDGCKMNDACREDIVELVRINDRDTLFYKAFPIDVCLLKASIADEDGNISCEYEPLLLEQLEMAAATRQSGGTVIVQVHKLAKRGTLAPKDIKIPGILVDYVVVGRKENTFQTHFFDEYKPELSGALKVPVEAIEPMKFNLRKICGRRGVLEIEPGSFVNVGGGISEAVANVAAEEGISDKILLGVESGLIGGVPVVGAIGSAYNPEVMIRQPECFDLYNGGLLDITFLGCAQVDEEGNVNVSKFNDRIIGPGGFVNITQNTKKVCFLGTFTAGKIDAEFENGTIKIREDGKHIKFVKRVEQVTFSGKYAIANGQEVLYITERAVFRLTPGGLMLVEIAPGIDLEKNVLQQMEFSPLISENLKLMDECIFRAEKMNISI